MHPDKKITPTGVIQIITDRHYAGRPGIDVQIELAWQRQSPLLLIRLGSKQVKIDFRYDSIQLIELGPSNSMCDLTPFSGKMGRIISEHVSAAVDWLFETIPAMTYGQMEILEQAQSSALLRR